MSAAQPAQAAPSLDYLAVASLGELTTAELAD
jgi:hypothetical protein